MDPRIVDRVSRFPTGPGVYIFSDAKGRTLYVGKAANLRARVRSYLTPGGDGRPYLRFLENEAREVEFVATQTEQEALLLENTVIKKKKPPYNIRLKDDKAFLMLRLDRSGRNAWPWFRFVRRRQRDDARYFGPYASAKSVRRTLRLLHKLVPLRDCTDHVFKNRSRPCLKHQIGRCPAPCVGLITREEYDGLLDRAEAILSGEVGPILRELRDTMDAAAEAMEYERAQALKTQIEALQAVSERQAVVGADADQDVLGLHRVGAETTAVFLLFRGGRLESSRRFTFRSDLPTELLQADLFTRFYEGDQYVPREIVARGEVAERDIVLEWLGEKRGTKVELFAPQRGKRMRHLEMAEENARLNDAVAADKEARRAEGLVRLAKALRSELAIERIHCLDVSTIQGTSTVASRVASLGGMPEKDAYRRFKISPAHAGDDFSAMEEAVRRSLTHALQKEDVLPDLLLVDGGRGQLDAAMRAVAELGMTGAFAVAGLAKSRLKGVGDDRVESGERLFLPPSEDDVEAANGPTTVPLPVDAPETLLVAAVRDEAHRFAITYHRKVRGKLTSELDDIPGVGPERRRTLLRHFGSLSRLRNADLEALRAVPGIPASVADQVWEGLREGK